MQKKMNLFMECQQKDKPEDMWVAAVRNVQSMAPSWMCDKKAATLSQVIEPKMYERYMGDPGAMGELRNVQRGVYEVQYRGDNKNVMYEQEKVSLHVTKSIVVVYRVVVDCQAVKRSAVVEDMSGVPLSLARNSVKEDSGDYSDREEVLAELSGGTWARSTS